MQPFILSGEARMVRRLTVAEATEFAIIEQYRAGKMDLESVCERLGLHRSTVWRKLRRIEAEGAQGLAHQLRGRPSNARCDAELKEAVCKLYETEYAPYGFNVAHFFEQAHERFSSPVSYASVVGWLKSEGLRKRTRKGVKHRARRARKEAFGEMLQMDTSIHDWLKWGRNIALVTTMDDATNVLCGAHFSLTDTTLANFTVLQQAFSAYGLPESIYVDRGPVYKVTRTGGIGRINQPTYKASYVTQFRRALDELGVELIYAYSPQAKGRIERSYGTLQGRLVPELAKNGIKDLDKANAFLREVFLPHFNSRFVLPHAQLPSKFAHIPHVDLRQHLAEKHHATVSNDHIVSCTRGGLFLKILPSPHRASYAKARVELLKHSDGTLSVLHNGEPLRFEHAKRTDFASSE
jgi:transposase